MDQTLYSNWYYHNKYQFCYYLNKMKSINIPLRYQYGIKWISVAYKCNILEVNLEVLSFINEWWCLEGVSPLEPDVFNNGVALSQYFWRVYWTRVITNCRGSGSVFRRDPGSWRFPCLGRPQTELSILARRCLMQIIGDFMAGGFSDLSFKWLCMK